VAAFAIPRQQTLSAEQERREAAALADSLRSAADLGHRLWLAAGQPPELELGASRVRIVHGYPHAQDIDALLEPGELLAFRARRDGHWQHRERTGAAPCGVRYAPPAEATRAPAIRLQLDGC
jgi:hypothetical protein